MDLRSYVRLLLRRWPVFVVTVLVVAGGVAGASLLIPPTYTAKAEVFFSPRLGDDSTVADRRTMQDYVHAQVGSYAELVTARDVLDPVIDELGLDLTAAELAGRLSVTIPNGTVVMSIAAEASDAEEAADIANAIAAELPGAVAQVENATSAAASPVIVETVEDAPVPERRTSPVRWLTVLVAALAGLIAGLFVTVLVDGFDTRLRSGATVARLGVGYLGGIRASRAATSLDRLVFADQSQELQSTYRRIAVDALFLADSTPATILVTSASSGEGRTTVAANIAGALAEAGNRVVYIDADARGGRLAAQAGVPQTRGVTDLVTGRIDLDEAVFFWKPGNFAIVPCGSTSVDVSEMLAGEGMARALRAMSDAFDVFIVDAPAVSNASEAARFTQNFRNVLVVAQAGQTRRGEFMRVLLALRQSGANVIGAVLTRVGRSEGAVAADAPVDDDELAEAAAELARER